MKKSTNGVFSAGGPCLVFLFCWACKSWNTKKIHVGRIMLLKVVSSSSLFVPISGIFGWLILTSYMPLFVLFIYFILFMLFAPMTLLDMTKQPLFVLLSIHMCYTTTMAWTFCIFHMHLFKWSVHYQVNKLPLSEVWELMVDGKKSVLSRILVISSLPHSSEFKRFSTSLFSLSLQSSAVGIWNSVVTINNLNFPMLRLWCERYRGGNFPKMA